MQQQPADTKALAVDLRVARRGSWMVFVCEAHIMRFVVVDEFALLSKHFNNYIFLRFWSLIGANWTPAGA